MDPKSKIGFHGSFDKTPGGLTTLPAGGATFKFPVRTVQTVVSYGFDLHMHPYVRELARRLTDKGVKGLEAADTELTDQVLTRPDGSPDKNPDGSPKYRPRLYGEVFSSSQYAPTDVVEQPYPVRELDFSSSGAYAVYNWELFYHVPLMLGIHLSRNQRFAEAQRWLQYIFDPTDDSDGPTPARFWKVKPFQHTDVEKIEQILVNLSTKQDAKLWQDTVDAIDAWRASPFRPHLVARYRQTAYMYYAVMAYLDNLVAWGDSLFRQDTGESIDEATQLYVLAAQILGPKPEQTPSKGSVRPMTYAALRAGLNAFGDGLAGVEADVLFDLTDAPPGAGSGEALSTLRSVGQTLYFAVPRNDKLLSYWDTVADRLFKIHNSLNLQGMFRQLPLFEPPIDPALLARAAASGVDASAVVAGLAAPLSLVRFQLLVQKAAEMCQEVKSLGAGLLAAIEKEDGEALSLLRAQHERSLLEAAESVRFGQYQEAIKAREGVEKSVATAFLRYSYYERLLGRGEGELAAPDAGDLDDEGISKKKLTTREPSVPQRPIDVTIGHSFRDGGHKLSPPEATEIDLLEAAQIAQDIGTVLEGIGAGLNLIPEINAHATPFGVGVAAQFGGSNIGRLFQGLASVSRGVGSRLGHEATLAGKMGSYGRREQDWSLQSNLAAAELTQLMKPLRAAQIREAVARREWENHQKQIKNAREIEAFLTDERSGKRTNQGFYAWMKRESKGAYAQAFQLAYEVAKKAERALQHELGDDSLSFVSSGQLAGREGLLAGEKLLFDVKRMELAYHEQNRREYELTKLVSLRDLDPAALVQLRATGTCSFSLPDEVFDLDCPGHYFRRIRSVAVSIPCVTGPYASVNCTLVLTESAIRKSPLVGAAYARQPEDERFDVQSGTRGAIVTSRAENDAGLFEVNLRDERYLPFEGEGAVSRWQLSLAADPSKGEPCQFDYDTLSDVVLHVRYTAREGGELLKRAAKDNLSSAIDAATASGSVRLLSVRHEFPAAWAKLKRSTISPASPRAELSLELGEEHYPIWSRGRIRSIKAVELYARTAKSSVVVSDLPDGSGQNDTLVATSRFGALRAGVLANIALPRPVGRLSLYVDDSSIEDLWLAVTWGK